MEPGKKKPLVKYNIQKLNEVTIGDSYVKNDCTGIKKILI